MAYGRLDVFWPEGQFKTFLLVDNNISVGRSSGNVIALETTTISRYHFSITHDGHQVFITDLESVNGTFVDGVKLNANEPRPLLGGEEIQIGYLRIIYHQIDEMPTQPIKPVDESTQRIEVQSPDFQIDVIGPNQPFSPGAQMSAELSINNTGSEERIFRVEVSGMPPGWIRVDRPELEIARGDSAQVLINFHPLRRSDSKPGDYPVMIRVAPKDKPDAKLEASLAIHLLPFSGFGMALESTRIASGERFRLHLHNQGSASLPLTLSGRDQTRKLRFIILVPKLNLTPGQRLVVQGEVKPVRPALLGRPRQHSFDFMVRSNDPSGFLAAVRGQFIEKPMLPGWVPLVLIAIIAAIGIIAVIALLMLIQVPPAPQITHFAVNTTQIAEGQSLALNWSATDASAFTVSVNGTPIVSGLGSETSGVDLDTTGLTGSVVIALSSANRGGETLASQTVFVYQPLGEFRLTVEPPQLVRYVVQNLSVTWNVPGAVKTHISGLESFSSTLIESDYGGSGDITRLAGIPSDTLHLTLSAEDEAGNMRDQTYDVPVIDPECLPVGQSVTLYAGPDVRYQVVGTVPSGAFVVVDAQDGSGQWLRARLPGSLSGWGVRSEFSCAQTFNVGDLVKELNVSTLPPATETLTPTTIPTATLAPTIRPLLATLVKVTPTAAG
jgi:FHA domain-containing protein